MTSQHRSDRNKRRAQAQAALPCRGELPKQVCCPACRLRERVHSVVIATSAMPKLNLLALVEVSVRLSCWSDKQPALHTSQGRRAERGLLCPLAGATPSCQCNARTYACCLVMQLCVECAQQVRQYALHVLVGPRVGRLLVQLPGQCPELKQRVTTYHHSCMWLHSCSATQPVHVSTDRQCMSARNS